MKTRWRNVSEDDGLTIISRNTRSKTSTNGRENTLPIPLDLILEIFSRLPVKSISKCRCVSKLWGSILRHPDFTELFLTRSLARPQLLFVCQNNGIVFFFSAPHPQISNGNSSSIALTYHMKITVNLPYETINHVNGLVLRKDERILEGSENTVLVSSICNPSTGQYLTLPKVVKTRRRSIWETSFLGYDPIDKQYKVLSITSMVYNDYKMVEYRVLTLGTGKPSWRIIESCILHIILQKDICINGVLYYTATYDTFPRIYMIVCFDVRSEKFRFVKVPEAFLIAVCHGTLINYNGKVGSLVVQRCVGGTYGSFKLLVLEDVEKEEWSEHTYVLSALCKDLVGMTDLSCVGVTRTNEIVLSSYSQAVPFYVVYYNMERNTMVRFELQGIDASKYHSLHTFVDHVEDVKLF